MAAGRALQPTLAELYRGWPLFSSGLSLDDMMPRALEWAAQVTQASHACLMLLDDEQQTLMVRATAGPCPGALAAARFKLGEGLAAWTAQNGQPMRVPDGQDVPAYLAEAFAPAHLAAAVCVPLHAQGHVLGVMNLIRLAQGAPFGEPALWFAVMLADRLGIAVHHARLSMQLASREQFVTRILESVPSSLVVIDRSLRVVSVNRNFLDKARREAATTLGRKIEVIFPHVLVETMHLDHKVRDIFRTGQPLEGGKVTYRAPGLPTRIYYYRLMPLKTGDVADHVMLLMDDITEREQLGEEARQAERHLASVVDCANDLVVSLDAQGRIVSWNPAAERVSGLRLDEVKHRYLASLCAAEHQPTMAEMLSGLAGGKQVRSIEINLLTVDRQEVPIAWNCSPMLDSNAHVVGIVAVGRDLRERRQLEAQLFQSAKMASLGVMAGGIAHELRNPLGIISASAQLLLERPHDLELLSQCGQKIHTATRRASSIIENLLKFARPQHEQVREVDLHAVLEETILLLAHQMALQKVALVKALQPGLPWASGNAALLQQVFANLILNACAAMPDGGTLTLTTRSAESGLAEISFRDTGLGIPSENLPKIFDPFFTTMPVGQGVGLGLSISYSIIQQHQGTIEASSQPGHGSTFTVRLPVTPQGNGASQRNPNAAPTHG